MKGSFLMTMLMALVHINTKMEPFMLENGEMINKMAREKKSGLLKQNIKVNTEPVRNKEMESFFLKTGLNTQGNSC